MFLAPSLTTIQTMTLSKAGPFAPSCMNYVASGNSTLCIHSSDYYFMLENVLSGSVANARVLSRKKIKLFQIIIEKKAIQGPSDTYLPSYASLVGSGLSSGCNILLSDVLLEPLSCEYPITDT